MIHVVAGAVTDAVGRVLIAQRPPGKHFAGGWEFPGGKLEPGETRSAALARELKEELGIIIRQPRPLMRLRHTYDFGDVLIDMWVVMRYEGVPHGLDGQALRWCTLNELATVELLPADAPIVRALRLPERLRQGQTSHYRVGELSVMLRAGKCGAEAVDVSWLRGVFCEGLQEVAAAVSVGAEFLVMRSRLSDNELSKLCALVDVPVFARGLSIDAARALGASGTNDITA